MVRYRSRSAWDTGLKGETRIQQHYHVQSSPTDLRSAMQLHLILQESREACKRKIKIIHTVGMGMTWTESHWGVKTNTWKL